MVKRVLIIALAVIAGLGGTVGAATVTLSQLQARRKVLVVKRKLAEDAHRILKNLNSAGDEHPAVKKAAERVKSTKKKLSSLDKKIAKAKEAKAQ